MKILEMFDYEYYMTEGCGIFAYALSLERPGGIIKIISNLDGEKWSKSIPFEVTHVVYYFNGDLIDAKGIRKLDDILSDFHIYNYKLYECDPEIFKKSFMGSSDKFPLFGDDEDITEALHLIQANPNIWE